MVGANCVGVITAMSIDEGIWFRGGAYVTMVISTANKETRFTQVQALKVR
jgi:hypothetical protein